MTGLTGQVPKEQRSQRGPARTDGPGSHERNRSRPKEVMDRTDCPVTTDSMGRGTQNVQSGHDLGDPRAMVRLGRVGRMGRAENGEGSGGGWGRRVDGYPEKDNPAAGESYVRLCVGGDEGAGKARDKAERPYRKQRMKGGRKRLLEAEGK